MPSGDSERVALGLPPLFQPFVEVLTGSSDSSPLSPLPVSTITDPSQLPKIHAFQPLALKDGDTCHSISMMPEFRFFSPEVSLFLVTRADDVNAKQPVVREKLMAYLFCILGT